MKMGFKISAFQNPNQSNGQAYLIWSFWLPVSFLHDYGMIKLIIELNAGFV